MARFSQDMLCTINRHGRFLQVSDASSLLLGYEGRELSGRHFSEFVHPEDLQKTAETITEVMGGSTHNNLEIRLIHREGHIKYSLWGGAWSEEDEAVYAVGRDVTDLKISRLRLEESEQRYRALFEHNQDIIFLENSEGMVMAVNQSFCEAFGFPSAKVLNTRASAFLPPEMALLSEESFKGALKGETMRCRLEFLAKDGTQKVFDAVKSPIIASGEIMGVQTIAKDITENVRSYETIQQQANKLSTIFESITDAFFTMDRDWNLTYVNSEAERLISLDRETDLGRSLLDIFPGEIGGEFHTQYIHALETGKAAHFTSFLKGADLWFRVRAFPSAEGLSVYFEDITEQENAKAELEKMALVANNTNNGVMITDNEGRIEWVNEGFTKLTGFALQEAVGRRPDHLMRGTNTDATTIGRIYDRLRQPEPYKEEILVYDKWGGEKWLELDVTPVLDGNGAVTKQIRIQTDITDRKKAQKELEKLSLVASSTTNGVIVTDKERVIEWVNEGFTRLTGYSLDEAVGRKPNELLQTDEEARRLHAPEVERIQAGEPLSFEILNSKKGGEEMWNLVHLNPIHGSDGQLTGHVAVMTDNTEKVNTQRELEKLSLVASLTNSSVVIADRDWRIEWVNNGFTRLYGYNMEEALGKGPSELLHSPKTNKGAFAEQEARLLGGEPISFEVLNLRKSGEEVWVSVEISPVFDHKGNLCRYVEVQSDITALKRSEQQQSRLASDLYRQNSDLQQFTYMVSHNLRAPVANVIGLAELLASVGKDSSKFSPILAFLGQSVSKLDQVLRDMNTVLSVRDRRGNLEREDVEIREVIDQALHTLKEEMTQAGGGVSIDIAEGFSLKANKAYLFSIFYNLLSNAIKYRSEDRSLAIYIKCLQSAQRGTVIHFSDNGSGFDMRKAKGSTFKLYQRFHTAKEGRGMGLYLVKSHVEALGGYVKVASRVGIGTRFLIYFPVL